MTKQKKHIYLLLCWIVFLLCSWLLYYTYAATWTISLEITGLGIRHGTPTNVNLWVLSTTTTDQEFSGQFSDYFWVEDLEWYITGHYSTIQCDGVYGPVGNKLTWIYLKAGDNNPTLIFWHTGNVLISTGLYSYASILSPMTYIYKPTDINNIWFTNRYWDKPRLKIVIPAYSPPGTYSGTIVFSFYPY